MATVDWKLDTLQVADRDRNDQNFAAEVKLGTPWFAPEVSTRTHLLTSIVEPIE